MSEQTEIKMYDTPLTIKDQLPFTYILANQILTFQKSILAEEHSEREIQESIKSFVAIIPGEWRDDEFSGNLKAATTVKKQDVRPQITGSVRMSEEVCEKLGIPAYKEKEHVDYYQVMQACVNLLNRRKLLSKIDRVEKLEGIDLESTDLEDDEVWKSNLASEQK